MYKKKFKKKQIFSIVLFSTIISFGFFLWLDPENKIVLNDSFDGVKKSVIEKENTVDIARKNYSAFVHTIDGAKIYRKDDDDYHEMAGIHGQIELELDSDYEIIDKYYKIKNSDYYVLYDSVEKIESLSVLSGEYKYYSNYVPFGINIVLKDNAKLYVDNDNYYEVHGGEYSVIINDSDRYGIEFNHSLVYVNKSDVENTIEVDSNNEYAKSVGVLNYHYTVSSENENGELDECQQDICITDTMFDKHISYLKENNFYGASIRDLELFIDGKVRLPSKSILITIDDGWYVSRSISILEKYQMLGTLFLIGSLASPDAYRSPYLEIHSHTWDMHTIGQCPSNIGRGGILCLDEDKILEDLRKSRESLNNTTYFCYPFYDYNDRAIRLLKESGFTMAFAGESGDSKVRVGQDKYKIPRFVVVNYTSMNSFINYVN